MRRQSPYLAFPFDSALLNSGAHPVVARRPAAKRLAPPPAPVVALPAPVPLPAGWRLPAAAAAVLLVAAGLYQWIAPHLTGPARPAPQAIALRVERTGAALRLVWDRESPAVRKARAGIVNISEGQSRLRIDLNAQQLASGSVVYFPHSPDVAFDMELRGPALSVTESVRAVVPVADLPPAPVLDARLLEPLEPAPPEPAPLLAASRGTAHRSSRRTPEAQRRLEFVPPGPPAAPVPAIDAPPLLPPPCPRRLRWRRARATSRSPTSPPRRRVSPASSAASPSSAPFRSRAAERITSPPPRCAYPSPWCPPDSASKSRTRPSN